MQKNKTDFDIWAGSLNFTKVHEQELSLCCNGLRVKFKLIEHIVDAVGSEWDTHTRKARHSEDACQVVVTSATRYTANLYIESFHLEDATCIIIETTSQGEIEV